MGSSGNRTRSVRPGGNSNRNFRSNGTRPSCPSKLFCAWKSWIGNLKEKNVFRRHQFRGFDGDFLRIKGPYCIILDLMRQWIFKCLASEQFVLATGSNLSLATGLASWKVSLEPCCIGLAIRLYQKFWKKGIVEFFMTSNSQCQITFWMLWVKANFVAPFLGPKC